jgi:hypothetical protein
MPPQHQPYVPAQRSLPRVVARSGSVICGQSFQIRSSE